MKDRVREALFNLLGPAVKGTFAVDLFGGTGALGLEAISRGSVGALIIERHLPTSKVIRENIETLELSERVELTNADTFRWFQNQPNLPQDSPWVVFVSPPYRFFTERTDEILSLITGLMSIAPLGSLFAVEATKEFDFGILPEADEWDVRSYPPAVVGVLVTTDSIRDRLLAGSD
jgi:16S rRNA (guanine966-N2)-methyltransferase